MVDHDARLELLQGWLSSELRIRPQRIEPASSDASFRRYFRAFCAAGTYIVMDAPPGREDVRPYLRVSEMLEPLGIHVPHVYEADVGRGLLLLEDLGRTPYLERLAEPGAAQGLYADALETLSTIQLKGGEAAAHLAPYDRTALRREMDLMPEWFLARHLGLDPTAAERQLLEASFEWLIEEALGQPQVFVHRDYHSRNLMVTATGNPGVLDFQDALRGPVGYDLVSLLKDCYIAWPRERVLGWVDGYRARLAARGGPAGEDAQQFRRWFDLIGVQRHLKVLGIFARLWHRDGKRGYLADLPLTLRYVCEACRCYAPLRPLGELLEGRVAAELPRANARTAGRAG
jgi:aminoglycoside/choline kinase family phosphotransferase